MSFSTAPGLFGINNSNRDFTRRQSWGKNQFNTSFPAALACYMNNQNVPPVYIRLNEDLKVKHLLVMTKPGIMVA